MKRVFAYVPAAIAALSVVLLLSASPVFAFASPNPHPNPDNRGHHYGWYKHPATPTPTPVPSPASQPTPQSHPVTSSTPNTNANQDPPVPQSAASEATPAAIVLPGQTSVIVVDVKGDDLAPWVLYVLLAGLALLWIGLVGAATVRSMTGRPAPRRA